MVTKVIDLIFLGIALILCGVSVTISFVTLSPLFILERMTTNNKERV